MAKVLVVGGAGYVGSTTSAWLIDHGHDVWVLDDLSTGHRGLAMGRGFTRARAGERQVVWSLLNREKFDCVMHFAAKSLVEESVHKPEEYFENNVHQTQSLLEAMLMAGVKRFLFSSTCAVFGDPGDRTLNEDCPKKPLSPYGETKLKVEQMMESLSRTSGLQGIALRYFNAAGADPKLRVGECHHPETHLIPKILKAAVRGAPVEVFGNDYPTPDGTCVRDYIHVWDLADAHAAAMNRLLSLPVGGRFEAYNLGSENGYSVSEIVRACEKVTGKHFTVTQKPRRPGDPPKLVADSSLAKRELGFAPKMNLEQIIETAWEWEKKQKSHFSRAIFLDRDGTLNEDPGYLSQPDQLKLYPQVPEALGLLKRHGFRLVVVSNQSGIGRGLIEPTALPLIHTRLNEMLKPAHAEIDDFRLCIHRPEDQCECRKPKTKLIVDAARESGIDLSRSYMIGDKFSDLMAGKHAHCKASILVRTGSGLETEKYLKPGEADLVSDSLFSAVQWILKQEEVN